MTRINSTAELRDSINKGEHDFFIALNFGFRSSKNIHLADDGTFEVINEIDDTVQNLSEAQLHDEGLTSIGKAIDCGAFYCYN